MSSVPGETTPTVRLRSSDLGTTFLPTFTVTAVRRQTPKSDEPYCRVARDEVGDSRDSTSGPSEDGVKVSLFSSPCLSGSLNVY